MAKLRNVLCGLLQSRRYYARLSEIGRFQEPKTGGKYEPGQVFPPLYDYIIALVISLYKSFLAW